MRIHLLARSCRVPRAELRRPANRRSVNRSNSSPHPELSVRANPPSSTLTVPGPAGRDPNPDPAPPDHQRHQQPGHHRQREHQHPYLGGVVGHLHVDERHRAVEPDDGAVVETGRLARAEVDPRLLGQPALLDQPRIEGEQRLRPAGVQAGVALVDVDGDGGIVERREARRQQRAVQLLGRREQALDGDLVLAAFAGIGIGAAPAGRTASRPTTAA